MRLLIALFILMALPVSANATVSENELANFCAKAPKPTPGEEFDGAKADPNVLSLTPGPHTVSGYQITVFTNSNYILRSPQGKEMAGCSKEQLSETLRSKNVSTAELK
jgi:hypothetical protein